MKTARKIAEQIIFPGEKIRNRSVLLLHILFVRSAPRIICPAHDAAPTKQTKPVLEVQARYRTALRKKEKECTRTTYLGESVVGLHIRGTLSNRFENHLCA